ncbi:CoA-binding protein [Marinospirillum insulare]|uniref:CoA-binding protein n=1 Tax=Marinospirillum insulare TaxID=217169 RepID=A0ABQ5ZTP5_9GAMM|nr:CoA-binding protein [Marinospirillum insulare]GLR63531.1 CoA-binding protein [Marinospirillum insulare]
MNTTAQKLMQDTKTIALVGISNKPDRASHRVAVYLMNAGYQLYFVNPQYKEVLGQPCYASLSDIPDPVEMVDIFRKAEDCLPVAEEAVKIGAQSIWLQLGISNPDCKALAEKHGIAYVEDACTKIVHSELS